jgi:hypothetical protein
VPGDLAQAMLAPASTSWPEMLYVGNFFRFIEKVASQFGEKGVDMV